MSQIKKNIKLISFLIFIIFLSSNILADSGTCELNKEVYNKNGLGSVRCSCTSASEQNRAGFFVWRNSTGDVLQSIATDSGSCRTSFFGDTYIFLQDNDFTGNVTFSLNADGSGDPISWDDVTDVTSDNFTYNVSSPSGCIIDELLVPETIHIGHEAINYFRVTDSVTGHPLVGAICRGVAFNSDNTPLMIEPYGDAYNEYLTGSNGKLGLIALFNSDLFQTSTNYAFTIECGCLNETGFFCLDGNTGEQLSTKFCTTTGLFMTDSKDYRGQHPLLFVGIIIALTFIVLAFGSLGYFNKFFALKIVSYCLAGIELIVMLGVTYGFFEGLNMTPLIKINFWSSLIIGVPLLMVTSLLFSIETTALGEKEEEDKKWNQP